MRAKDFSVIRGVSKLITHDCDQHVEHGDLGEESGHQNEYDHELSLGIVGGISNTGVTTEWQPILIEDSIEEPPAECGLNQERPFIPVQIEHTQGKAECN